MSRARPQEGCHDLAFDRGYAMTDAGEVALEDYTRTLAAARAAEVIPDAAGGVKGVHVCGGPADRAALHSEVQAFARELERHAQEARPPWR